MVNPNWPTLFAEADFYSDPYYGTSGQYTDLTPRLTGPWSVRRGVQFELDAIQSAQFTGTWRQTDGAFDPGNHSSPYAPGVLPYRGLRMRAQYPPSQNLLTGDQATGGEVTPLPAGTSGAAYGIGTLYTAYQVAASSSAWQGTQVWQSTGTTVAAGFQILYVAVPAQAVPGTPYSFTVQVRSATTGANPTVQVGVSWLNAGGGPVSTSTGSSYTLTGSPTASWTTATISGTVPAISPGNGTVGVEFFLNLTTAPSGTWSIQIDGLQIEQAAAPTAFVAPGPTFPIYGGMIERYPQTWNFSGTYGLCVPVGVDTMAMLSQQILLEAFTMEVTATAPQWFFMLNDASGSTTFAEQAGRTTPAGLYTIGTGSCAAGSSVTSASPAGTFLGTDGPVVTFNNSTANQGTLIDLTQAGIVGPPTTGGWTRMIAFRTTSTTSPDLAAATNGTFDGFYGPGMFIFANGSSAGLSLWTASQTQAGCVVNGAWNDGNWHLMFVSLSSNGLNLSVFIDGQINSTTAGSDMHPVGCVGDGVGGDMYNLAGLVESALVGDVAHYAQWNSVLSLTAMNLLYATWRRAGQNESTDARYARILRYAQYTGPTALDLGSTVSLGPANDINNLDALTCLQNVVNTEAGRHYVATNGVLTFKSRYSGFVLSSPTWTFGENQAGGEIPYANIAFDFDPTRISNFVTITEQSTNQTYIAADATSQTAYGTRTLTRTSQANSPAELSASAFYFVSRYKQPAVRVNALRVDAGSNPALFPSVLGFEIGQRVRINRRDQSGNRPTMTIDGYIEQITHTGTDTGSWLTDLQISPVPPVPYAVFTALRTTLFTGASAGASSITIAALPDASTNPLRSELIVGQQLIVGSGATAETVTIAPGGVPNALAGYTSATITLTAALINNHSSGEAVTEYPGAVNDAIATFDASAFSF